MAYIGRILFLAIIAACPSEYKSDGPCCSYCCPYCRGEPKAWVTLGRTFKLSDNDATNLQDPAAYLVNDEEEKVYKDNGREYKLFYGGAPLLLTHEDLSKIESVKKFQYLQFDLAEPKVIGGVYTQGGFYEEKFQGLYPNTKTWVTTFVLSYSNNTKNFYFYKNDNGGVYTFQGNTDATTPKLVNIPRQITARYLRYHALKAQDQKGATSKVNSRVNAIVCSNEECNIPRINCLLSEWTEWSECLAQGNGYTQTKTRTVRRIQACGGARCGSLFKSEPCTPAEPAWKSIVQYLGIALMVLVVFAIIGIVAYKKTHRDRVEVIVVKEQDSDDEDEDEEESDKAREARAPMPAPMRAPAPGAAPMHPGMPRPGMPMMPGMRPPGPPGGLRPGGPPRPPMFHAGAPAAPRGPAGTPMAMHGNMGGMAPTGS